MISPSATISLLNAILEDYELDFLHTSCFNLKASCFELQQVKEEPKISEKIIDCTFDIRQLLSFKLEANPISVLDENLKSPKSTKSADKEVIVFSAEDFDPNNESLTEYLNREIAARLGNIKSKIQGDTTSKKNSYIVRKIFTESGISTNIRICKTKEEALEFISKIEKAYPELKGVCTFKVEEIERN